jgi:hypothetical protein
MEIQAVAIIFGRLIHYTAILEIVPLISRMIQLATAKMTKTQIIG